MRTTSLLPWIGLFSACSAGALPASEDQALEPLSTYSSDVAAEPLPSSERRWVYTEVDGAVCRDGSPAGVAVSLGKQTDKLMIFLEQGGTCFNEASCLLNPANTTLYVWGLGWLTAAGGVFDRSREENPVRDWNFAYVPYCTGDLHMGSKPDAEIPGVGPQKFVGYHNLEKILPRIRATFDAPTDVLLAGASAGGFGSFTNAAQVQAVFPEVKVKVLNDSGPPISKAIFPECFQDRARMHWGADQTLLAQCGEDCPDPNDYLQDFGVHVANEFADRPVGVIASLQDSSLLATRDATANDCKGPTDLFAMPTPGSLLRTDLLGFRERVAALPNFSTFYPDSDVHVWTETAAFYESTAGKVRLIDWFRSFIAGQSPGHAGP